MRLSTTLCPVALLDVYHLSGPISRIARNLNTALFFISTMKHDIYCNGTRFISRPGFYGSIGDQVEGAISF